MNKILQYALVRILIAVLFIGMGIVVGHALLSVIRAIFPITHTGLANLLAFVIITPVVYFSYWMYVRYVERRDLTELGSENDGICGVGVAGQSSHAIKGLLQAILRCLKIFTGGQLGIEASVVSLLIVSTAPVIMLQRAYRTRQLMLRALEKRVRQEMSLAEPDLRVFIRNGQSANDMVACKMHEAEGYQAIRFQ
jgi:hypothetical protein